MPSNTVTITGNTTLAYPARYYAADVSGGGFTATLPAASANNGRTFTVKNISFGSGNTVAVARTGGDLIEGGTSDTIAAGEGRTYFSDGTNWYLVN